MRSRDVDVKVFGGEVESLAVAEVEGVGVRVIVDQRQGYAWAGSLDADVVAETLAEARDNAGVRRARRVLRARRRPPTSTASPRVDARPVARRRCSRCRPPTRSRSRSSSSAATRADRPARAGRRVGDATATPRSRAAVANSLGVEASTRRTVVLVLGVRDGRRGRRHPDRQRLLRRPQRSPSSIPRRRRATPPSARCACSAPRRSASARLPVVLDPLVTRSIARRCSAARSSARRCVKGRSLFVGREGEAVAGPGITLVDDPTIADVVRRRDRTTPRACRPAASSSSPAGRLDALPAQRLHRAPRAAPRRTGSAVRGGFKSPPGVGARALHLVPGDAVADEILASVPEALYVQSVSGLHSGTNPVSGDFSVGADGLMVRDGELAEPVREVTIASTLQRMLHDIVARRRRPHVAARRRRRHDPPRRRHVRQRRLTHRPFSRFGVSGTRTRRIRRRQNGRDACGQAMPVAKMTITITPTTRR